MNQGTLDWCKKLSRSDLETGTARQLNHSGGEAEKFHLRNVWQENSGGLLFPNRNGRPRKRQYVVKFGLKPLLRKLVLPTQDVGLHAFRHGLGTALSNSKVSPKTVQQILRHTI